MNPNCAAPRIAYALRILLQNLGAGVEAGNLVVYSRDPANDSAPGIRIVPGGFFGKNYGTRASLPKLGDVPFLFGKPVVEKNGNRLVIHADLVASTFFLVTRYEEWIRREVRDEHGRFPGNESLAARARFLHRPVVDEYRELIRGWLADAGVKMSPPVQPFRVVLTHDVDVPFAFPNWGSAVKSALRTLRGGGRGWLTPLLVQLGLRKDPCDTFDWLAQTDREFCRRFRGGSAEVIYFVMAAGPGPHDGMYAVRSRQARRLLRRLADSGARIGLHASYAAGGNPELIAREVETLAAVAGKRVAVNRHHFLRWREPEHVAALEAAGITDDYTLGYGDRTGFRLGTCQPFRLFNLAANRETRVTAHPLVIMECSLSRPQYMGLGQAAALAECRRLLAAVAHHKGEAVLLWHNTEFMPENQSETNYHRALYPSVLAGLLGSD